MTCAGSRISCYVLAWSQMEDVCHPGSSGALRRCHSKDRFKIRSIESATFCFNLPWCIVFRKNLMEKKWQCWSRLVPSFALTDASRNAIQIYFEWLIDRYERGEIDNHRSLEWNAESFQAPSSLAHTHLFPFPLWTTFASDWIRLLPDHQCCSTLTATPSNNNIPDADDIYVVRLSLVVLSHTAGRRTYTWKTVCHGGDNDSSSTEDSCCLLCFSRNI